MHATCTAARPFIASTHDSASLIEPLETRIAPATLYAISNTNHLLEFDSVAPEVITHDTAMAGLSMAESVVGMDFRPATGQLYVLTKTVAGAGNLYTVNLQSAAVSLVATLAADPADLTNPFTTLNGTNFGVDFNPVPDRLRVVSDTGQDLRVNPGTGLVITDADLNPGTPSVSAVAYTNSFPGTTATTLYDIDAGTDQLLIQNPPNNGTLTSVGALGVNTDGTVGFDIGGPNNDALAALRVGGTTQLHRINLDTGAATLLGAIGDGSALAGFAMAPGDLKLKNAKTATFTDEDGDLVTVTVSKGTLKRSDFVLRSTANGSLLSALLLNDDAGEFDQANVSITATPHGGDGFVRVGAIDSTDNDLGTVSVDGDLSRIVAGDGTTTDAAVKSLTVASFGRGGASTQPPGGGTDSQFNGPVGSFTVKTDFIDAQMLVLGGPDGVLGKLTISGSLMGGATINSGIITTTGGIGPVKIGQDVRGGTGMFSGNIITAGTIGPVTVGGSMLGNASNSAQIAGAGGIGAVKIGRDIQGGQGSSGSIFSSAGGIQSLTVGGSMTGQDAFSGLVQAAGAMGTVLVKGDLRGGPGSDTAELRAASFGAVTVLGSIVGSGGGNSGSVSSTGAIKSVKIGHELIGGLSINSGSVTGTACGAVTIGLSVIGGSGFMSGMVSFSGPVTSVKIGGDLRGGSNDNAGYIHAVTSLGPVSVLGSIIGGSGDVSGVIFCGDSSTNRSATKSVTVGGDVMGGTGFGSGSIGAANGDAGPMGNVDLGPVVIKGDLIGSGQDSGSITGNHITSVFVGGDLRGGTGQAAGVITNLDQVKSMTISGSLIGGSGNGAGTVSLGQLGTGKIGRDVRGGTGISSGAIFVNSGTTKSLTVGGSVLSGANDLSGAIQVATSLGSLSIGGDVTGTGTTPVQFVFPGSPGSAAVALGKLTVKGSVSFAQIVGGYIGGTLGNADANLGSITIGGDFIASSIVAGVVAGGDGFFGTLDDAAGSSGHTAGNVSRIAGVIIKGHALGTIGGGDAFGIVAQEIGTMKIGGGSYGPLNATVQGPVLLSVSGDFFARTDV